MVVRAGSLVIHPLHKKCVTMGLSLDFWVIFGSGCLCQFALLFNQPTSLP